MEEAEAVERAERLRVLLVAAPFIEDGPADAARNLSDEDKELLYASDQQDLDLANACLEIESARTHGR